MRAYIIKRMLLIIPTVLFVTIIVFTTVRLIPGNVVDLMGSMIMQFQSAEDPRAAIEHELGLDRPVWEQYGKWMAGIFRGDLGKSLWTSTSVTEEVSNRIPVSFELAILSMIAAISIALPIGVYSAIRQDTWGDYLFRSVATLGICIPGFWLGTMVMIYPSIWWNWSPRMTYIPFFEDPIGNLEMFLIPASIQGMWLSGVIMRLTRTMMLDVLRQDYIRTAWSKGLKERTVVFKHAVKNALVPVVTMIGLQFSVLIGGTIVMEQIFSLPGLGQLIIEAIGKRDYTVISGINVVLAGFVLVINLLVDMSYSWLDPRIRYQ